MEQDSSINNEISKITELIHDDDSKLNVNIAECVKDIVKEIEDRVNADSINSTNKEAQDTNAYQHNYKPKSYNQSNTKHKSEASLAYKMRSRLIKYQQHCDDYKHKLQRSDKRSKSGNNPLFAYPSIPPPIQFDPKYDIGNVDNYTKFAGRTMHDGKDVNLLETVERLYQFKKSTQEKMDAQRYLKYHDEVRELQSCPLVSKSVVRSKSQHILPLYMRSEMIAKTHDKAIRDKQNQKLNQLEQELQDEMHKHEQLTVHGKSKRQKFTVEEWEIYYNKRFKKYITSRAEEIDKKAQKMYNEIMANPHTKQRSSRGDKIEDRLISQGEAYKDKLEQIRKHNDESPHVKCISKASRRILKRKFIKQHAKQADKQHSNKFVKHTKSSLSDIGSAAITRVDSKTNSLSPFSLYKSGVKSDFLSIPMTSPGQHLMSNNKLSDSDEHVCAYKHKIRGLESSLESDDCQHCNIKNKSRNKQTIEQLIKKTGKTAGTTFDSRHQRTGKSSHSGVDSLQYNRSNKDTSSDDNLNSDSVNQRLGETQTIEKMINGDYDDEKNGLYYSIGNKDSFGIIEPNKDEFEDRDPALVIDPFYPRHDDSQQQYDDEEFETARLNTEDEARHNNKSSSDIDEDRKALMHDRSASSDFKDDASFDNIEQMKQFLKSIKNGINIVSKQFGNNETKTLDHNQVKNNDQNQHDINASESQHDEVNRQGSQHDELNREDSNNPETLEMIQEETEHDTTKQKDFEHANLDRLRSPSLPLIKARKLIDSNDEQSNRNEDVKCNDKVPSNKTASDKDIEKRTEALMNKVISSAYSSKNSFKGNLIESLDLNQNELKELEELGIDALTIIKRIMAEYPQLFGQSLKKKSTEQLKTNKFQMMSFKYIS